MTMWSSVPRAVRLLPFWRDRCSRSEHLARCRGALLALSDV